MAIIDYTYIHRTKYTCSQAITTIKSYPSMV